LHKLSLEYVAQSTAVVSNICETESYFLGAGER